MPYRCHIMTYSPPPQKNKNRRSMAQLFINTSWQALAVNVQMLGSLINTIHLSSKDNSLTLPTNCDTLSYN